MDETIYIWSTLHEHFETNPERRRRAQVDFFAGRISYEAWFNNDLELLSEAGADREGLLKVVSRLPIMPGAFEALATLRAEGRKLAIISGSISLVIDALLPDVVFDYILINRIFFDESGRITGGLHTPYDVDKKADGLIELARREGLSPKDVAFVGDNTNDVSVARAAGKSIAFNCKSEQLGQAADVVVDEHDLRAILCHLD